MTVRMLWLRCPRCRAVAFIAAGGRTMRRFLAFWRAQHLGPVCLELPDVAERECAEIRKAAR
jgi:hypothetical protein